MRLYNRLKAFVVLRPVALAIIAIGWVGGVWGFIGWYGPAFARYPVWQWPFVPDCPLFALLFTLSLGLLLIGRNWAPYNAIVALGLIKYGVWTVTVWILFWANGGPFTTESIVMTVAHTGMVLEGLFLLSYLKMDWPIVAGSAIWFGLSDWMDYGPFQTYPHFPSIIPYGIVQWHTVGLTVLLTALYSYMAWRRRQRAAAESGSRDAMKRRRSQWLWAAVLCFATLGASAVWRGIALWGERALLYKLGSSLSPAALALYVAAFGGCGAGLVAAAVGLWFWRGWARHVARACVAAYVTASQTYTWFFVRSGLTWERRWVSLVGAVLGLTIGVGVLTWPRARAWLGLA